MSGKYVNHCAEDCVFTYQTQKEMKKAVAVIGFVPYWQKDSYQKLN